MTWEIWFTFAVITAILAGLVLRRGPTDAVLLGGAVLLGVAGIITPAQVFGGFTNQGLLAIAGLFVVAEAMRETGALEMVGRWVFGNAKTERVALLRMALPVTFMSAFLNNTPIVVMLVPVLSDWCRKHNVSPSRLLIPLSYLAILGGTCTLIGTSTNLVVNGLISEERIRLEELGQVVSALRPITMFELSKVGVPFAIIGILYLLFIGRRLLPDRRDLLEKIGQSPREYLVNMEIQPKCRLIGQSVADAGLRHLPGLFLIEVVRGEQVIAPVGPEEYLNEADILTFSGVVGTIVDLERIPGLVPVADEGYEMRAAERRGKSLCEAVISTTSPLVGKTIREGDFRATYNAAVIAAHRGGERIEGRIGDIVLRPGDTLLLQAGAHFSRAHRNNPDFYLVSDVDESRPVRHDKAAISLILLGFLVVMMSAYPQSVVLTIFLVAGLMVGTRCISATAARQSVDWQTLLTFGAALAVGKALDESGGAQVVANSLVNVAGRLGPHGMLALVYVLTTIFNEMVTNRAAVILMFPVALGIAGQLGVDARPFIMACTFAATSTFVTPLGYQTNLMVYGPGGYKFSDFVRVGLPLTLILMIVATFIIPLIWPFEVN